MFDELEQLLSGGTRQKQVSYKPDDQVLVERVRLHIVEEFLGVVEDCNEDSSVSFG